MARDIRMLLSQRWPLASKFEFMGSEESWDNALSVTAEVSAAQRLRKSGEKDIHPPINQQRAQKLLREYPREMLWWQITMVLLTVVVIAGVLLRAYMTRRMAARGTELKDR